MTTMINPNAMTDTELYEAYRAIGKDAAESLSVLLEMARRCGLSAYLTDRFRGGAHTAAQLHDAFSTVSSVFKVTRQIGE